MYADWHWRRVAPIVSAMSSKGMVRNFQWRNLRGAIEATKDLVAYIGSEIFLLDTVEERCKRIEPAFIQFLELFSDPSGYRSVIEEYVKALANLTPQDGGETSDEVPESPVRS